MGEGRPGRGGSEAHANVPQDTILDQRQWNKGTPKHAGDAVTQGIYPDASDENAHAGDHTSGAQRRAGTEKAFSGPNAGHGPNPATYGSMKDGGRPASGATSDAQKKVDGEEAFE